MRFPRVLTINAIFVIQLPRRQACKVAKRGLAVSSAWIYIFHNLNWIALFHCMASRSLLFSNASLLLSGSFVQKIFIFFLNQLILSKCSPLLVGKVSIQLELLLSVCLYLSRESIRMVCLRVPVNQSSQWQPIINLSWLPCLFVIVLSASYLSHQWLVSKLQPSDENLVVGLYALSAFIECLGEPQLNVLINGGFVQPKLLAESGALAIKSITTYIFLVWFDMDILSFGCSQLCYAITFVAILYRSQEVRKLSPPLLTGVLPGRLTVASAFDLIDYGMLKDAYGLTGGLVAKLILTEADKIALTVFTTAENQGLYALASNYGSIMARLIFLPLEEAGKLCFTHFIANIDRSPDQLKSLYEKMQALLRAAAFCGSIIALFGPFYIPSLLSCLLKSQWVDNRLDLLLSVYCVYVFALSVNGVSEAFVHSCAPAQAQVVISIGLTLSSSIFALSSLLLSDAGAVGIVVSNLIAMVVRIAFNWTIIEFWYRYPAYLSSTAPSLLSAFRIVYPFYVLKPMLPTLRHIALCGLCVILNLLSQARFGGRCYSTFAPLAWHIFRGGLSGCIYLGGCYIQLASEEQDEIYNMTLQLFSRQRKMRQD